MEMLRNKSRDPQCKRRSAFWFLSYCVHIFSPQRPFYGNNMQWMEYGEEREADRPRPGERTHVQFALSPAVTVRSIHHLRTHWRPPRGREGGKESSATLVEARPLLFGQPIDRGLCHAWTVTEGKGVCHQQLHIMIILQGL